MPSSRASSPGGSFAPLLARLKPDTVLVLDDLHYADTAEFRAMLPVMLTELPRTLRCICLSRTLPPEELSDLVVRGRDSRCSSQSELEFSAAEARDLVKTRLKQEARSIDVGAGARLGGRADAAVDPRRDSRVSARTRPRGRRTRSLLDTLGRYLFFTLPAADQDMLS